MKISVICPSFLGEYPNCAPNRVQDFMRAVNSFKNQSYKNKELIIVSDGCNITNNLFEQNFLRRINTDEIKLQIIPKQPLFSGAVRQAGLEQAEGEIVCYLDHDDYLEPYHLQNIASCFSPSVDWIYFNAYWILKELGNKKVILDAQLKMGSINTGCIAHRRGLDARWDGWVGVRENWHFISQLIQKYPKRKKIGGCGYVITNNKVESLKQKL